MRATSVLPILLALGLAGTADAASMRCGSSIVKTGDTKLEVLDKCGEPALREVVSGADDVKVEIWTYRGSPTRLTRVLTFRGSRLERIESERTR